MEIKLIRHTFTDKSTIGEMSIDGRIICQSLEDVDRRLEDNPKAKIKGKTAIPIGRYRVIRNMSGRFKKVLPLLLDVPGFEGIRIHPGNSPDDTEGCILPGMSAKKDWVGESRAAFSILDAIIESAIDSDEKVYITIERERP